MKKKSQTQYIAIVVIVLLVLLLFLAFESKLYAGVKEAEIDAACKASVQMHAGLHILKSDFSSNIKCPTKDILINYNLETEAGQESAKRAIANSMYSCWNQFLEGKKELFGEDNTYCAICSIIDFKQKDKQIAGFSDFLIKNNVPNKDLTYSQYLTSTSTKDYNLVKDKIKSSNDDIISTSSPYSVIFVYAKGNTAISRLIDYLGGPEPVAAGAGVAGLAGGGIAAYAIGTFVGLAGWPLVIVTAAGALTIGTASAVKAYFLKEQPQWIATTMLTKYSSDNLYNKLGCRYLAVEQANK